MLFIKRYYESFSREPPETIFELVPMEQFRLDPLKQYWNILALTLSIVGCKKNKKPSGNFAFNITGIE